MQLCCLDLDSIRNLRLTGKDPHLKSIEFARAKRRQGPMFMNTDVPLTDNKTGKRIKPLTLTERVDMKPFMASLRWGNNPKVTSANEILLPLKELKPTDHGGAHTRGARRRIEESEQPAQEPEQPEHVH